MAPVHLGVFPVCHSALPGGSCVGRHDHDGSLHNGSEFINDHLWQFCRTEDIQFTRGRPYKKDDDAHIEQKNCTHVRKLMGYVRYDTAHAVVKMNAVHADLRLLQNLFLPSVKLVRKERVGAPVRRRYDAPCTPLEHSSPLEAPTQQSFSPCSNSP